METEIIRLRGQAIKARRLMAATSNRLTQRQLRDYAQKCDDEADQLS